MSNTEKHPGGRPLKFESVEKLQEKIDGYFENCEKMVLPHTVTGLAVWLNTTRDTLMDYQKRDQFSDTIKKAKLRCEAYAEKELYLNKCATGPIFALKNFGWKDKRETEHSGEVRVSPIYGGQSNVQGHDGDQKNIQPPQEN